MYFCAMQGEYPLSIKGTFDFELIVKVTGEQDNYTIQVFNGEILYYTITWNEKALFNPTTDFVHPQLNEDSRREIYQAVFNTILPKHHL